MDGRSSDPLLVQRLGTRRPLRSERQLRLLLWADDADQQYESGVNNPTIGRPCLGHPGCYIQRHSKAADRSFNCQL